MLKENLGKFIGKQDVIADDGRMDSPGHSAQYCKYTRMENESKDILSCVIKDKRMTGLKSTMMEVEMLKRALNYIEDSGVTVVELVTDASTSVTVTALMRRNILSSSILLIPGMEQKRLWEEIRSGKMERLYSPCGKCNEWTLGDGAIEPRCDHGDLEDSEKKWLEPGGSAHMALTMPISAYKARHFLAMLDYMQHKDRPELVNKNGDSRLRLHRCYSKRNSAYSVYSEKVPKTYSYMTNLLEKLLTCVFTRTVAVRATVELTPTDRRKIRKRVSAVSPLPTKSLIESKKSRFGDTKLSSEASCSHQE